MPRLLIQFYTDELAEFRWSSIDESQQTADIDWQQAGEDELASVAAQHPDPVILFLPQQCVYLTQVEMPERAGRQLLAAIEYQIEDQLAQDIESQHFAIGDNKANPVSIAVVERSIMARCIALAQAQGLRLMQILPELFLCPWQGSGVAMMRGQDGWLLRYGDYRGLKCSEQLLPVMFDLIKRDVTFNSVDCFGPEIESTLEFGDLDLQYKALDSAAPGFVNAPVLDLQQRDYQMSSAWQGLAKTWKWIALLLAALLIVGGYNKAMALQSLEQDLAELKQQQYALLKPYLSDTVGPDDNLKKALIDRLKQLQTNQGEQGFLQLLLEFTRARGKFPEVNITRIGYQGKELVFDISSTKLNNIEAMLEVVQKQGVDATLVSLSIKPELSSGRLVLRGGDDV
jgi:general secretion pathway protein L